MDFGPVNRVGIGVATGGPQPLPDHPWDSCKSEEFIW